MAAHTNVKVPVPENGRVSEIVWHIREDEFDAYAAVYAAGREIALVPLTGGGSMRTVRGEIDGTRVTILGYAGAQPSASVHVTERAA